MDITPYARMVYDGGIDIVVFPQLFGVHLGVCEESTMVGLLSLEIPRYT